LIKSIIEVAKGYGAREIGVVIDFDPTFYERFSATEVVDKLWAVIEEGARYGIVLTGYWHQIFQVLAQLMALNRGASRIVQQRGPTKHRT